VKNWYQITAKAGTNEVIIYDEIGAFGISAKQFIEDLKGLGAVNALNVRINSPGGSVFDGTAIFNALKYHPAKVTVWIDGLAASIASMIAMAGDTIFMPENAMMMIHDPSGLVVGTADDMEKMGDTLRKIKSSMVSAYRNKSGLSTARIEEIMSFETWLTANEAVDQGFADQVAAAVKVAANFDLSKFQNIPASEMMAEQNLTVDQRARNIWNKNSKIRAEFKDRFETYLAYCRVEEKNDGRSFLSGGGHRKKVSTGLTTEENAANQNLPIEDRARNIWQKSPQIRAEFHDNFDTYLAYRNVQARAKAKA